MRYAKGIFLLSIVFCLHGALSSRQWLRNNASDSLNSVREFTTNDRRLHIYGRSRNRNAAIVAEMTSSGVRVATRRSNAQAEVEDRGYGHKPAKFSKQSFVFATSLPLLQHPTSPFRDTNKPISPNNTTAVVASPSYRRRGRDYDVIAGTKYLCWSQKDCEILLKKSYCGFRGYCECRFFTTFDGEICQNPDLFHNCSTHKDCSGVEDSRCVLVQVIERKICMCEEDFVLDAHRCLRKVGYLQDCVSEVQCSSDQSCLDGICRPPCDVGKVWKFNRCTDVGYLQDCVSDVQCSSDQSCLDGICRPPCGVGKVWKFNRCTDELPRFEPSDRKVVIDSTVLFGIIGSIPLLMLSITLALLIRRHCSKQQSSAVNSTSDSIPNSQSTAQILCNSADDQPPSYDEIMTASTQTLPTNAEGMCEGLPPSYKSWEETQGVLSTSPRR